MDFAQVTTDDVAEQGVGSGRRADADDGSTTHRSTSRSTSTSSIPPMREARARPRRVALPAGNCWRCSGVSRPADLVGV